MVYSTSEGTNIRQTSRKLSLIYDPWDFIKFSTGPANWAALSHQYSVRDITSCFLNLLKPTGHVMHQQFNIQQLYVLPALCLYVLYLSENKQRLVSLTA